MGLFRKKQEINQTVLTQLSRIADSLEQSTPKKEEWGGENQKKAAYALNLCLVSISQIIDYSDLYVLEQEYEGILNNLNLENMPKDEALLDILRQILDTITFFRIQEGDKRFIEQEYQNKMRAAIWSAIPSCNVLFHCESPQALLLALVSSVGTGYMNYRRTKAEAGFAREKAEWELQKAAIEQFNGLRRELFTTAWRLMERYDFADELRLTENQIEQYNRVLMDTNLERRLVRLKDIEKFFEAYAPFWYFKGHTALELSCKYRDADKTDYDKYRNVAKGAYDKYFKINNTDNKLLRVDPIYATCSLEYVSVTDDKAEKLTKIKDAIDSAGGHFDILQLCAMAYLDIGEVDEAADLLRRLVCEGYNDSLNAQLLSSLYIKGYLEQPNIEKYKEKYDDLCKYTDADQLIDWPKTETNLQTMYDEFVEKRRNALLDGYANFMCYYYAQKSAQLQKLLSDDPTSYERNLVRFTIDLEKEIAALPSAHIPHSEFVEKLNSNKKKLDEFAQKGYNNQRYEEVYKDIFVKAAENIAARPLLNMEQITEFELELRNAVDKYMLKSDEVKVSEQYSINALLGTGTADSVRFQKIKTKIIEIRTALLNPDAKKMEVLIAGEVRFNEYLGRHDLFGNHVIAVINDSNPSDCDLILTENGLLIHEGQSKIRKTLNGTLDILSFGISYAIRQRELTLRRICREVPYSQLHFDAKALTTPSYNNKYINMDKLLGLVKEIQNMEKNSVDKQIRDKIEKGKKQSEAAQAASNTPLSTEEVEWNNYESLTQGEKYLLVETAMLFYIAETGNVVSDSNRRFIETHIDQVGPLSEEVKLHIESIKTNIVTDEILKDIMSLIDDNSLLSIYSQVLALSEKVQGDEDKRKRKTNCLAEVIKWTQRVDD